MRKFPSTDIIINAETYRKTLEHSALDVMSPSYPSFKGLGNTAKEETK